MTARSAEGPGEELRFKQDLAVPVAQGSERRPGRVGRSDPSPSESPCLCPLVRKPCHSSSVGHGDCGGWEVGTCTCTRQTPLLLGTTMQLSLSDALGQAPLLAPGGRMCLSRTDAWPREQEQEQEQILPPWRPRGPARLAHSCSSGERPPGAQGQLSTVDACSQATEHRAPLVGCSGAGAC